MQNKIIQNNFRKLHVCWLKNKPERMQKFIIIEGDPLIRNNLFAILMLSSFKLSIDILLIVNYFISAFVKQCLCQNAEEVCIIENENHKKISVIYHIDKQIYLCIILQQFDTKYAGTLVNQASNLLAIMFIYINFNIYFNTKEYVSTFFTDI